MNPIKIGMTQKERYLYNLGERLDEIMRQERQIYRCPAPLTEEGLEALKLYYSTLADNSIKENEIRRSELSEELAKKYSGDDYKRYDKIMILSGIKFTEGG